MTFSGLFIYYDLLRLPYSEGIMTSGKYCCAGASNDTRYDRSFMNTSDPSPGVCMHNFQEDDR